MHIKAIRAALIKHEMEAELDDEQGVLEQEAAQLAGVREAFVLANEEGFDVSALRMSSRPRQERWACQSSTTDQSNKAKKAR